MYRNYFRIIIYKKSCFEILLVRQHWNLATKFIYNDFSLGDNEARATLIF